MKQGDLRKREILNTAELLFCKKGYEQTSIQDILDELNTSKGSFYHHFISKESLLEGICQKRAEQIWKEVEKSLNDHTGTIDILNTLLSGMIPLNGEKLSFMLMLMPVFLLPEGRSVRQCYSESLSFLFRPALVSILRKGNESGDLFCYQTEHTADLMLSVVHLFWIKIFECILEAEAKDTRDDFSEMLHITELYRMVLEQTVSVPYGSIELIGLPALKSLAELIHNHRTEVTRS